MWSRKSSPVATLIRPRPSSATRAVSCVSLLLRTASAVRLLKSHLYRMRVRAQSFQRGEPHTRLAKHLEVTAIEAQNACALQERVHAERRCEACRARCRKRVIGARRIVAQRHGRVGPDEDRAGVLDPGGEACRLLGHDQ